MMMGVNDYFDKMYGGYNYQKRQIQNITIQQTSPPQISLVTSAEAKNFLKVSYTTDDNLIADILKTSHFFVETQIQKCLCSQSFKQMQQGGIDKIRLLKCPIVGTPTVTIYEEFDSAGEVLTSSDVRIVDNVLLHVNKWFDEYRAMDGYVIEYDVGMFDTDDFSDDITQGTASVGTASTEILASDADRSYAILLNYSDYDINIALGASAVLNSGIKIEKKGGFYEMSDMHGNGYRGAVNAIVDTTVSNINYMWSDNYISTNDYERTVIKNVILRMSAFLYENRQQYCQQYNEENWSINYNLVDIPMEFKHLLAPMRQNNLGIL
jgi:uncharacterized phiE125 gp8 family phage protein